MLSMSSEKVTDCIAYCGKFEIWTFLQLYIFKVPEIFLYLCLKEVKWFGYSFVKMT